MSKTSNHIHQFSIIIPVYNAENHLQKCLDSILNQTYDDYEIVFINDGSKDNSKPIIEKNIAENPEKTIILYTQRNSGAGTARNKGIELSSGKYIVFVDSDDYLETDYLEKVNEKIESCNADVVFIDIVREDEMGHIIRYERMSDFSGLTKDQIIRSQLTGKLPWGGWRKITRASIIKENNLQYANIKVGEESIFSFNIINESESIQFQPEAIYHYVDSQGCSHSNSSVYNLSLIHI